MKHSDFTLSDISIRKFLIEDYTDVISLWEQAGLPFRPKGRDSKDKIVNELNKPAAVFLIAELNGKIIGTSFGTHDGRKGWINRVAVKKDFRKKGVARLLVEGTEKQLFQKGIEIIACLIEDWNDTSMEAFKKMGYVKHEDIIYFSKRKSQDV